MGNVFKDKLQQTTEYLKEALELDELDEAVKWEVKVTGLPVFYSDGKSKGAVKQIRLVIQKGSLVCRSRYGIMIWGAGSNPLYLEPPCPYLRQLAN